MEQRKQGQKDAALIGGYGSIEWEKNNFLEKRIKIVKIHQ
jgi:hypothetical protein